MKLTDLKPLVIHSTSVVATIPPTKDAGAKDAGAKDAGVIQT